MGKYFIVIDMQNDFCTGALANDDAVAIIPKIKAEMEKARSEGFRVIFTRDTHGSDYMQTSEGKHLPVPHCLNESEGWMIVDELKPADAIVYMDNEIIRKEIRESNKDVIVNKTHFGWDGWKNLIERGSEVRICGTVTSICVSANSSALKSIDEVEVVVLKDCCADLAPQTQEAALAVLAAQQCVIA